MVHAGSAIDLSADRTSRENNAILRKGIFVNKVT